MKYELSLNDFKETISHTAVCKFCGSTMFFPRGIKKLTHVRCGDCFTVFEIRRD